MSGPSTLNKKGAIKVKPDIEDLEEQQKLEQASVRDLLGGILVQMKILNRHMALITTTEYKEGDV